MNEDILREDDLGAAIPLDALRVTDLPRSPQYKYPFTHLPGTRAWRIALLTIALVVVMVADIQWGSQMLTWISANPPEVSLPTLPDKPAVAIAGASRWQQVALPVADNLIEWLVASPSDPKRIYACAGISYNTSQETIAGPPTLWMSGDAGAHWQVAQLAMDKDARCALSFDDADAQHMVLYAEDFLNATQTPCAGTLSLSADGGRTWQSRHIAPVYTSAAFLSFYCTLTVTAHHIYIMADFTTSDQTTQQNRDYTELLRSDDDGISWQDITPIHTDGISTFFWTEIIAADTLIGRVNSQHTPSITQTLWESFDAGSHWQHVSAINGLFFDMFLRLPTTNASLYGITSYNPPSRFFITHALYSMSGKNWAYLPNLPARNTSAEHPGIFTPLGVTTQGNLLVVGIDKGTGLPLDKNGNVTSQSVPLTLWEWDRVRQQWQYLAAPIPLTEEPTGCNGCFQSSLSHGLSSDGTEAGTYVVLKNWYPSSAAWRIFIPDLS